MRHDILVVRIKSKPPAKNQNALTEQSITVIKSEHSKRPAYKLKLYPTDILNSLKLKSFTLFVYSIIHFAIPKITIKA